MRRCGGFQPNSNVCALHKGASSIVAPAQYLTAQCWPEFNKTLHVMVLIASMSKLTIHKKIKCVITAKN